VTRKFGILLLFIFLIVGCTSRTDEKRESPGFEHRSKSKSLAVRDEITIGTDDGKALSAYFWYSDGKKDDKQALVILVHQFRENKDQWPLFFIDSLLVNSYKVVAYDIRGHGKSSRVDYELTKLLSDANEATMDMSAVVKWAKEQAGIDSTRIGAVGTSIGGNLACYAKFILGIRVAVAISNSKRTFETFTGYDERMMRMRPLPRVSNVLLICGNRDGEHENDQKYIFDNFLLEPRDMRVYDSDKHGKFLLLEHPEIYDLILNWLKKYL